MSLNINGDNFDTSYRYKMSKLEINTTGNGKNSHTILNNIDEISESLGHPSVIILKFIGFKLGTNIDESKKTLKGHHEISVLQNEIFNYINNFVMCQNCHIPELIPEINKISKKKKEIKLKCSACGNFSVSRSDKYNDKITDYMIKYIEKNGWHIKKGTIVNDSNDFDLFNL